MSAQLEVPKLEDLSDLGIAVDPSDQPGVVSLVAWANDGSTVTLTCDEIAGSASVALKVPSEPGVRTNSSPYSRGGVSV